MRRPAGMGSLYLWAFCTSSAALLAELLLMRVFDVILSANTAYTVITAAIFGTGLGAAAASLRPVSPERVTARLRLVSFGSALLFLLLLPICNALPFEIRELTRDPWIQVPAFFGMYGALVLPFFLHGWGLASLFEARVGRFPRLYLADLTGAAVGATILPFVLPHGGPFGVLALAAAAALLPVFGLAKGRAARAGVLVLAVALASLWSLPGTTAIDFRSHAKKRGPEETALREEPEFRRWDPVSKIEVVDLRALDRSEGRPGARKLISYDGGSQSSHIYRFDGDYEALRHRLREDVLAHFWQRGVLAGHHHLRGSGARVLAIGCAGGQEVKAALLHGAAHVDAIDLVETVVDLGHDRYAAYNGGLFLDPRVRYWRDEGRSWLRRAPEPYDLIQIFSYHNSSRIASGALAVRAFYLHTVEAYRTYFHSLGDAGVLQVSQAFPQRVLTTAGRAWSTLGRDDFRRHVFIAARTPADDHPTILIKMRPWTETEVRDLEQFFLTPWPGEPWTYEVIENPLTPEGARGSFLSDEFFRGRLSAETRVSLPLRFEPVTDDRPFYHFVRTSLAPLSSERHPYVDSSAVMLLTRGRIEGFPVPRDLIHLFMASAGGVLALAVILALPFRRAQAGRGSWPGRASALGYFACLGAGFVLLELAFVQSALRIIGLPVYAFTTVLAVFLVVGGLGSWATLGLRRRAVDARSLRRWALGAVVAVSAATLLVFPHWSDLWLARPLLARMGGVALGLAPLCFFLGMPMPLGIAALAGGPRGAVSWAWAINSAATVAGGTLMVVVALFWGVRASASLGVLAYVLAFFLAGRLQSGSSSSPR